MKRCLYCAEAIQDDAIKCRFCNESLPVKKKEPWYFSMASLIISFCCVGPFMLPLVWFHPTLAKKTKITSTIIIIVTSILLFLLLGYALIWLKKYYIDLLNGTFLG